MQTITDTPTTISVPSGELTENSSIETITNAVNAALVKSGSICYQANHNSGNAGAGTGPGTANATWRKVLYYCYTHGANVSHSSKDYKNSLGDHTSKPNATRCDTQGHPWWQHRKLGQIELLDEQR